MLLAFGSASLWERAYEAYSFRDGGMSSHATVLVGEKSISRGKRRTSYSIDVVNPVDDRMISVPTDPATFDRAQPLQECATLLVEQAPNGAQRLVRPVAWHVACPWVSAR